MTDAEPSRRLSLALLRRQPGQEHRSGMAEVNWQAIVCEQ